MKNSRSFIIVLLLFLYSSAFCQSYLGVTNRKVNLREGPSDEYEILSKVNSGSHIFVFSLDVENDYYSVIDIKTNLEGYIHKKYVKILREIPKNEESIFTPVEETASYNPSIVVYNNTSKELTLKLNGSRYIFEPHERNTIEITSGFCNYVASAPSVIPYYGTEVLKNNYTYSWEFYITRK